MFSRNLINADQQKLYQQLKFLQNQNLKLKDELSDAKDLIKMNKIEIDVLSKDQRHDKKLIQVIYNYRQQSEVLVKKNALLIQNYHKMQSQKLMLEQLNQGLIAQQKSIQQMQKSRTKQLMQMIKDLQEKIIICERNHQTYDSITGFVQKTKQLFTVTQQAIQFKKREQDWAQQIDLMNYKTIQHEKNRDNLLLANGILRNKVVTLQAKLAMPNKNLGQILDKSLKRLMMYFIQTQKKMLTGDDSDSQQEDLELIAPQLISFFPDKQYQFKVSALDMLKVRNHQMKGIQKIKEDLDKRNHMSQAEKVQKLFIQLDFTRRSLTKVMIKMKSQSQRRKILQKICQELEQRNNALIRSNQIYQTKISKIKKQYKSNKDRIQSIEKIEDLQDQAEMSYIRKESIQLKKNENLKARENQVNKYLESVETPFEYKLHLQLLAKDLSKNPKLQNINTLKNRPQPSQLSAQQAQSKLKRSTSNPFLFFKQTRDVIQQEKPQKQTHQKDQQARFQQTECLMFGQNVNQKMFNDDDLDQVDDL